ncbi:MAG: HAMP domain-containing protein, partial [Solirubrobacterales bacterium]|nr:HAMP domain-containing protein [Solirubrobacterales bacterium]
MSASAVALAVVIAALVCYLVVRSQLLGQVDSALRAERVAVQQEGNFAFGQPLPGVPPSAGGPTQYYEIVAQDGTTHGNIGLPINNPQVAAVANGSGGAFLTDVEVGGSRFRELVFPMLVTVNGFQESGAVLVARPLDGIDNILENLRLVLLLVCAGGIALGAVLGRLAARPVLSPLAEVAATARHIEETEDLSSRIHVHADDEVGQLATQFNAMIERLQHSREALDESVRAQRQLVADASHELRTPITSLRTNIEVLLAGDALSDDDRHRLLADVLEQSEELSALIGDVIELARGDLPITSAEDVRLDRVVADCLTRARRDFPQIRYESSLEPVVVDGVPERLARAINNLLDNAAHHSAAGGLIEVIVDERGLIVRDHGTGIDPADLPYVFDRFYRGANSRNRQGSGLG